MFVGFKLGFGTVVVLVIVAFMFIQSGILAIFARGPQRDVKRAKATKLFYAAIGLAAGVILGHLV